MKVDVKIAQQIVIEDQSDLITFINQFYQALQCGDRAERELTTSNLSNFYCQFSAIVNAISEWYEKRVQNPARSLNYFSHKIASDDFKNLHRIAIAEMKKNFEDIYYLLQIPKKSLKDKIFVLENLVNQLQKNTCEEGMYLTVLTSKSRLALEQSVEFWLAEARQHLIEELAKEIEYRYFKEMPAMGMHILNYCIIGAEKAGFQGLIPVVSQFYDQHLDVVANELENHHYDFRKQFLELYTPDYMTNNLLLNLVDAISRTLSEFIIEFSIEPNHGIPASLFGQFITKLDPILTLFSLSQNNVGRLWQNVLPLPMSISFKALFSEESEEQVDQIILKDRQSMLTALTPWIIQYLFATELIGDTTPKKYVLNNKNLMIIPENHEEFSWMVSTDGQLISCDQNIFEFTEAYYSFIAESLFSRLYNESQVSRSALWIWVMQSKHQRLWALMFTVSQSWCNIKDERDHYGRSVFYWAIVFNQVDTVKQLILSNPTRVDECYFPSQLHPIDVASKGFSEEMILLLLKNGAKLHIKHFISALQNGQQHVVAFIIQKTPLFLQTPILENKTAVRIAAEAHQFQIVKLLHSKNALFDLPEPNADPELLNRSNNLLFWFIKNSMTSLAIQLIHDGYQISDDIIAFFCTGYRDSKLLLNCIIKKNPLFLKEKSSLLLNSLLSCQQFLFIDYLLSLPDFHRDPEGIANAMKIIKKLPPPIQADHHHLINKLKLLGFIAIQENLATRSFSSGGTFSFFSRIIPVDTKALAAAKALFRCYVSHEETPLLPDEHQSKIMSQSLLREIYLSWQADRAIVAKPQLRSSK